MSVYVFFQRIYDYQGENVKDTKNTMKMHYRYY